MTLEEKIGYFFFDKRILKRALTRQAYALEQALPDTDQDAYLMLGQAVLHTVLTELLIRAGHQGVQEIWEAAIARQTDDQLAAISQELGIGFVVKMSAAEKQEQGYDSPTILADTLKAVIGGIYFDGGFSSARAVVVRLFQNQFPSE